MRAHALAAARAGFEPHLFCAASSSSVVETPFGIVHRVASPARPFRQLVAGAHAPVLASAIEAFLAGAKGPHVIHAFGVWGCAAVLAARRLARRGVEAVPLVSSYTTYGAESRSKLRGAKSGYGRATHPYYVLENLFVRGVSERAEEKGYRGARLVLVNYESVRRLVVSRWGSGIPIRLVPYAAESAFAPDTPPATGGAPPSGLPAGTAPLLLSVSRQDPRKGIDVLLRALARLKERRVPFRACLAGEGLLLETNRRLAASLGLGSEVVLPGFVPEVLPYLERADVFVLPSREEQSGSLSLLEALQAGRPVVASACDGIPEDVTDRHDALLVPPGDASALAGALERVLGDPALRARLARAARATFEERFGADRVTRALANVWAECGQTAPQSDGRPAQHTSRQRS